MPEESVRTFVAIELPEDISHALGDTLTLLRRAVASADVKWVSAASIHITLKFLGDVPVTEMDEIVRTLGDICAGAATMRLHVAALGAFPSTRQPRVVWAGLGGDVEPLASLARKVDDALSVLGFARENRPFTPHLTLARIRAEATDRTRASLGDAVTAVPAPRGLSFEAVAASVMRSHLTPRGAVYSRIASLPFSPPPDVSRPGTGFATES